MQEFVSVSASSYDPAALIAKLNEKAAEGWSVVAIVPTGGDVTAFLARDTGAAASVKTVIAAVPAASATEAPGWAVAPEAAPMAPIAEPTPAYQPAQAYQPQAYQPAPAYQPAAAAAPAVPADWYADPSGRFDLRYWDGSQWSEHVSRAGQQFSDPPVAG